MDGIVDRMTVGVDEHNSEARPVCKWMNYIPVSERSPIHMATFEDFHCNYSPMSAYPIY
jgi:hypothetical protein